MLVSAEMMHETMDFADVRFTVKDNGKGMNVRQSQHVFQPFSQADGSITRKYGGTGLGLSICQRLTELMFGKIHVESEPGFGTSFTVDIPMYRSDELKEQPKNLLKDKTVWCVTPDKDERAHLRKYLTYYNATFEMFETEGELNDKLQHHANQAARVDVLMLDGRFAPDQTKETLAWCQASNTLLKCKYLVVASDQMEFTAFDADNVIFINASPLCRSNLVDGLAIASGVESPVPKFELDETEVDMNQEPPTVEEAREQGSLILLVEDNPLNQKVILDQLNMLGYAAEVAMDGELALKMWQGYNYPLVLTDIHMPNMSGYDLVQAIRKLEKEMDYEKSSFVIAVTANALKGEAQKCFSVGMNDFVTKPVELATLSQLLKKWMPNKPKKATDKTKPATPVPQQILATPAICFTTISNFLGKDPAKHQEYLNSLLSHGKDLIEKIDGHYAENDKTSVQGIAHQLKSAAKTVGALELSKAAEKLERTIKDELEDDLGQLVGNVKSRYIEVKDFVAQRY